MALDPAKLAAATSLPILIVQGGKDIQVPVSDAERLKVAQPKATLVTLSSANHILKDVAGDSIADNIAVYRSIDKPLSEAVIPTISEYILTRASTSR